MRGTIPLAVSLVLLGLALSPGTAAGQEIHGLVLYNHDDLPVGMATVRLVAGAGEVLETVVSDVEGRFRLSVPGPGEYWVHVEHLTAFSMVDGPLEVQAATSGAVALVTFHLVPRPLALEEISVEVEGRSLPLARTGFYQRQRVHPGYLMDSRDIERRAPLRTSDLVRTIPGVIYAEGRMAGFSGYPIMAYTERTRLDPDRPVCYPRVWVDGVVVEQGGTVAPFQAFDDLVQAHEVIGMEVYRSPAETPAQFGGLTACGAILLWTRQGG